MARYTRFTFLCNRKERKLISALAERLQRSESDAVRYVVKAVAEEMGIGSKVVQRGERQNGNGENKPNLTK